MDLDLWLLQRINEWVARSPGAFYEALAWGDRLPWVIAACTLVALWYTGRSAEAETDDPDKDDRLARVQSALSAQGAFPSDHAVMYFTLATGVFSIAR